MARWTPERLRKARVKAGFSVFYAIFLIFVYGPMFAMFVLSFQGRRGGTSFPMRGSSFYWWERLAGRAKPSAISSSRTLAHPCGGRHDHHRNILDHAGDGVSQAFSRLRAPVLRDHVGPDGAGRSSSVSASPACRQFGLAPPHGIRPRRSRASDLAVRLPGHDGGLQPLRRLASKRRRATWEPMNGRCSGS